MPSTTPENTDAQKKSALYTQAVQEIRNRHFDEFQEIVADLYEANGFTYRKRLSEEEKAEQEARALFAANPSLAERLLDLFPQGEVSTLADFADSLTEES